ncbi:uncharacterized protein LOC131850543 [Achroia grisella]|uniref:uncharacterized protein LOC131850543 n=1 Tax=Achroia grisella TaxID=688607 RepID=UPI0027D32E27|nr:uncharacterized protein LOC131850543 [Achroia grisella]
MVLLFHILLILFINLKVINNFVLEEKKGDSNSIVINNGQINFQDVRERGSNIFITKPFFQIIQNLTKTKTSNLKSNIFDKMLSDEMLSIKRLFHQKNLSHTPIQITSNVSVPTPTIDIKQKWPAVECISTTSNYTRDITDTRNQTDTTTKDINLIYNNDPVKKAVKKNLGLRSLPKMTANPALARHHHLSMSSKVCTCMKNNPSTTCSYRCTGITKKICTHTSSSTNYHRCTRTVLPLSMFPAVYVPYETYFVELSTNAPNEYYDNNYGDKTDEYKSKHKHKNRPYKDEDLYYEDTEHKGSSKLYNNEYYDYYLNKPVTARPHDIDSSKNIVNGDHFVISKVNQDKLVNEVEKDLKKFYSNVAIKDCYCSSVLRNHIEPLMYYLHDARCFLILFIFLFLL